MKTRVRAARSLQGPDDVDQGQERRQDVEEGQDAEEGARDRPHTVASETTKPELVDASFKLAAGKLPVYYPSVRMAVGGYARATPLASMRSRRSRFSKVTYPAFRLTYALGEGAYFGQYYGVQGTTWKDAPILPRGTHSTVNRRGRTLQVYKGASRPSSCPGRPTRGVYWVSNSLSLALTKRPRCSTSPPTSTRVPG